MTENSSQPVSPFRRAGVPAEVPADVPIVAILGDGQLARMMYHAAVELGVHVRLLAGAPDASAAQVTSDVTLGDYRKDSDVAALSRTADAVTFDHEHVPNEFTSALITEGINVQPQPDALIYAQDKLLMRQKLREIGAPVPPFLAIDSVDDALGFSEAVAGQVCLKARRGGYDGKGVWFPSDEEDLRRLVSDLLDQGVPLMAEKKVAWTRELSALVARTPSGAVATWPVVESVQREGICTEAIAIDPELLPDGHSTSEVATRARSLAEDIASDLGVTGVLAVELFEVSDEDGQPTLIVNELAMRPHNTGHWTQDGSTTSQFEQHLRAVLDYPLGDTTPTSAVTVMANVLGDPDADPTPTMHERVRTVWAALPQVKVHLYGKDWRPGRKIGHVNLSTSRATERHILSLAGTSLTDAGSALADAVEETRSTARAAAHYLAHGTWPAGFDPHR